MMQVEKEDLHCKGWQSSLVDLNKVIRFLMNKKDIIASINVALTNA